MQIYDGVKANVSFCTEMTPQFKLCDHFTIERFVFYDSHKVTLHNKHLLLNMNSIHISGHLYSSKRYAI